MIRHWIALDLEVFRRYATNDPDVRFEILDNHDGTYFIAYDIRSFPDELVIGKSPTMALALERGVFAVEPLKKEEPPQPPFHGRCEVCHCPGLYVFRVGARVMWFCNIHRDRIYSEQLKMAQK